MLAVYDCMLYFRAATRPSRVDPLFQLVDQGEVVLALSADVLAEVRDVLSRPKLVARYPALTSQAVDAFVAHYLRLAKWVHPTPEHYVLLRDPKDSKYLNLSIEAAAPYLVSDDKDLLDLMDAASIAGQDFRSRYPSLQVVSPSAFLSIVAPLQP